MILELADGIRRVHKRRRGGEASYDYSVLFSCLVRDVVCF